MSDVRKYSASQLQTSKNCLRLWFINYVMGLRSPSTPSQKLGTDVHAILEKYLKGEIADIRADTKEGEIAQAGLPHLPPPNSGRVEHPFRTQINDSIVWHGYIDYSYAKDFVLVLDHKTTSDFRYVKTSEELKENIQAIVYAWSFFNPIKVWDTINFRWIYYRTRGPAKAKPVDLTMTFDEVLERAVPLIQYTIDLDKIFVESQKRKLTVLDLPPNVDHCNAYGGCYFKAHCSDLHKSSLFD